VTVDQPRRLRLEPTRQVALAVPAPISGRLDALLALANAADEPGTRAELIAALILGAQLSPDWLAGLVTDYRTAKVRDSFIPSFNERLFLSPVRRPGPRGPDLDETAAAQSQRAGDHIDPTSDLRDAPVVRLSPAIPEPLDDRLEELVNLADSAGARTSRSEIVGGLIFRAEPSADALADLLRRYRREPPPKRQGRVLGRRRGRPRKDE
jgi:hypothetical protein